MRQPFVAGNWKMNNTLAEARSLMAGLRQLLPRDCPAEVAVCVPFTLLYPMGKELESTAIQLGAQNCYFENSGAFTGEVSPSMLKAAGCKYVIIGHSERRQLFGESGDLLKRKVKAAIGAGLRVIYCIGETLEQRQKQQTQGVLDRQIAEGLSAEVAAEQITVAYEPVWAIGTGLNATAHQAQDAHKFIRGRLAGLWGEAVAGQVRIQYGGSVKPSNAAELLACPDVDGALVGGASLAAADFAAIISASVSVRQ